MSRIHFEEEQRFFNVRWIWFAFLAILLIPLFLIPLDGSSRSEIGHFLLPMAISALPMALILFFTRFQIKIDNEGIRYRFIPNVNKWRLIPKKNIESFEVREKKTWFEKMHCGYYRSHRCNSVQMNITGRKMVYVKLVSGQLIKIGSENAAEMEYALKRLTTTNDL